jgi:hypothetical protein
MDKRSPYAEGRIASEGSDNFPDPDVLALKSGEDLDLRLEQFEPSSIPEKSLILSRSACSSTQFRNFQTLGPVGLTGDWGNSAFLPYV